MRKLFVLFLAMMFCSALQAREPKTLTGIEVLRAHRFDILQGKRVGLITNPTGVDSKLQSTVDILFHAKGVKLVALFGPEHGVRGDFSAGAEIEGGNKDEATGLKVYSLYGKTKKPSPEMLKDIDVLVYDIQDIGCRSYTFISTMGLAMEAAAEAGKEFVVLDRPNPLGGIRIEGNVTEDSLKSFVSQFKIPYVYGLTEGELARLLNGEGMLKGPKCKLTVVPMQGWKRSMNFMDTGLPWVPSSPHIPHDNTSFFYVATGIIGELETLSTGIGYTIPFETFAEEWINPNDLAKEMNSLGLPGVIFRPMVYKPYYSIGQGKAERGVQVHITDYDRVELTSMQFYFMQAIHKLYPDKDLFKMADKERWDMFDKVCGSKTIRKEFCKNFKYSDIKAFMDKDIESFRNLSEKYYLYK